MSTEEKPNKNAVQEKLTEAQMLRDKVTRLVAANTSLEECNERQRLLLEGMQDRLSAMDRPDNHHNAALCQYCSPEAKRLRGAVEFTATELDRIAYRMEFAGKREPALLREHAEKLCQALPKEQAASVATESPEEGRVALAPESGASPALKGLCKITAMSDDEIREAGGAGPLPSPEVVGAGFVESEDIRVAGDVEAPVLASMRGTIRALIDDGSVHVRVVKEWADRLEREQGESAAETIV